MDFNTAAAEVGELVTTKNQAYGDSFAKCGEFLRLLWPEGIPVSQYGDALCMCRIFDKQMRIATCKDAFGESPYRDIAGYGLLGMVKDESQGAAAAIAGIKRDKEPPAGYLCHSCQRNVTFKCHGEYPATNDGGCEGYISALRETSPSASRREKLEGETAEGLARASLRENMLDAKQEAPTAAVLPLDFTLPSIMLKCTAEEAAGKFWSEREEWKAAKKGSLHELVERWDCLQALYTFAERGGDVEWYQDHVRVVMEDLARYHADGGDVVRAKRQMLRKNAKRGYYSPVVNEAILSTCGHRFTPVMGGPA